MRTIHTLIERGPVVFSDESSGLVIVLERGHTLTAWLYNPGVGYFQTDARPVEVDNSWNLNEGVDMVCEEAEEFNADLHAATVMGDTDLEEEAA